MKLWDLDMGLYWYETRIVPCKLTHVILYMHEIDLTI